MANINFKDHRQGIKNIFNVAPKVVVIHILKRTIEEEKDIMVEQANLFYSPIQQPLTGVDSTITLIHHDHRLRFVAAEGCDSMLALSSISRL